MALETTSLINEGLSIFVTTGDTATEKPLAFAQDYSFNAGSTSEEINDLFSQSSDWDNPAVVKRNYSINGTAYITRGYLGTSEYTGNTVGYLEQAYLNNVPVKWSIRRDGENGKSGIGIVTEFTNTGSVGTYHTATFTILGQGSYEFDSTEY